MTTTEYILAVPRAHFDGVGAFQGFRMPSTMYAARFFEPGVGQFIERKAAEIDPNFKQVIPYCLITQGNKLLRYTRGKSGGENRLHSKRSVGIGGHINPIDGTLDENWLGTYYKAIDRELKEELHVDGHLDRVSILPGMINDDTDDVGKVHLGFVEVFIMDPDCSVVPGEAAIHNPEFVTLDEAFKDIEEYEKWSQLVLNNVHLLAPWLVD